VEGERCMEVVLVGGGLHGDGRVAGDVRLTVGKVEVGV
jgi:hypothetical protein